MAHSSLLKSTRTNGSLNLFRHRTRTPSGAVSSAPMILEAQISTTQPFYGLLTCGDVFPTVSVPIPSGSQYKREAQEVDRGFENVQAVGPETVPPRTRGRGTPMWVPSGVHEAVYQKVEELMENGKANCTFF
jgi:hypothetical protein